MIMKTSTKLRWHLAPLAILMIGFLMSTDASARKLYKSVSADGKITYSNHPPSDSKKSQNVSSVQDGMPKLSVTNAQPPVKS
jgi:hypothetical protein